jgi:hypothetical protein
MENNPESVSQQYGDEAKFFTETRLLQKDVEIILESVNNTNFVGSIIHPVTFSLFIFYGLRDFGLCFLDKTSGIACFIAT